jgi:hypothetical protein
LEKNAMDCVIGHLLFVVKALLVRLIAWILFFVTVLQTVQFNQKQTKLLPQ